MIKSTVLKKATFTIIALLFIVFVVEAQINFPTHSVFKYLKGNQAQLLGSDWMSKDFDDSGWNNGVAPFRYGDGLGGTELNDMRGNYSTVFMRSTFTVQNLDLLGNINILADWDDGFILYINGDEVLNRQGPTTVAYNSLASDLHESGVPENFRFSPANLSLIEGENTIAVIACNITLSESSDFYFDMSINANVELPELIDSVGLRYSSPSGFYDSNFDLSINSSITDASIIYTLDGSNPQNSNTSTIVSSPATININPESSTKRGTTPAVVVRASIIKEGYKASKPSLRTYIYLDKVKTQSHPGGDWPTWNINEQHIDLDMDPDVVNSTQYKDVIEESFLDIPTISLVTDNANLFDASTGIYVNALEQGPVWERECSVELIKPDGSQGFNVNAGLRIRGGWSRHDEYPKHAFRLFFREEYGNSKLYYPLFEDEGVARFDKIDLRCAQNYSWSNWNGQHNTFIREVFARDAQGETGSPYTRSRYYHLYLNGMYWGMFQTQERSEARWASDYFDGDNEDYDVIKIAGVYDKAITATDGNLEKWKEVYNMTLQGFENNANYFNLEGKDSKGLPKKYSEVYVDIDNLIDYMINIFYTGNYDAPVSAWSGNKMPNNMYAVTDREDKSSGFIFLVHDAEHTMHVGYSSGPGIGIYENRANIGNRSGDDKMEVWNFSEFHSQWLHYKLSMNKEYRIRFADKAWKHLNGNGIFTTDACVQRLNKRAKQIDLAIIAESARWGDTKTETPYTKDNAWIPELNELRLDYFPFRGEIVKNQLAELQLYPTVDAPKIMNQGNEILDNKVFVDATTSVTLNSVGGEIYYTLNGRDPREVGGGVAKIAIKYTEGDHISISESVVLKARVFENGNWSAIKEADFIAEQTDYSNFKVTEIHYHPTDSIIGQDKIAGGDYEFIEFKNIGKEYAINLTGLVIDSAIYYEFPDNVLLAPGEYFIVSSKPKKFYTRYGWISSGNFSKSLANSGEQILVTNNKGIVVMDFEYSDDAPWPTEADGDGPSLTAVSDNPTGDPNNYKYWKYSTKIHGSPFMNDDMTIDIDEEMVEDFTNLFRIYPNPTTDILIVQKDADFESFNMKVFDVNGSLIYTDKFNSNAVISFKGLGVDLGVYILQVAHKSSIETKKIIYSN